MIDVGISAITKIYKKKHVHRKRNPATVEHRAASVVIVIIQHVILLLDDHQAGTIHYLMLDPSNYFPSVYLMLFT